MLQDMDAHLAKNTGSRRTKGRPWLPRAVVGVLRIAVFTTTVFIGGILVAVDDSGLARFGGPIGVHAAEVLAQQAEGGDPAEPPAQGTGTDEQERPETNSKPTPSQSTPEELETFTPSETIEADREIDFPYDI